MSRRRRKKTVTQDKLAENYMSVADVAKRFGVSRKLIYNAIARGELEADRLSRRIRLTEDAVLRWTRQGGVI